MANKRKKVLTNSFFIGIFIMSGVIISFAVIIWLGANQFLKENIKYATYFEGSVEGLETGSAVKYLGVPVGTIMSINVAPDGKLVEVIIQLDPDLKISKNLRVKVEIAGLAGGKFLQLYYPNNREMLSMHPTINFTPEYDVIKSSPSGLEEITIAMRSVLDNLNQIDASGISDGTVDFLGASTDFFENQDLYNTIAELHNASQSLANIMRAADTSQIVDNLELSSYAIRNTADHLNILASNLKRRIDSLLIDKRFNQAFDNFDSTMLVTRETIGHIGKRADVMFLGLSEVLVQIQETNRQLKRSLRSVTNEPGRTLLSEPPPRER